MDIIYLLINDVKFLKNYPHICLIIYIFSTLLLVISSVVLILLINVFINKVVNLLSVIFNEYIVKITGGGPDPNSGGGPYPNSEGGPDPNSGGGPDPNSGGMAPTGKTSKKRRTRDKRDADLKEFIQKNPFPLYDGQTKEEYDEVILQKELYYYGHSNRREKQKGFRQDKNNNIYRGKAEKEADIIELMKNNPQKENESNEIYMKRIQNKDYRVNTYNAKTEKFLKEAFPESKSTIDNKRRTRTEVKASKEALKNKYPIAPGQSLEQYEKFITNKDDSQVKKQKLEAKKKAYEFQYAPESFTQPQNAPESSTQPQNAGESFSQDDIYGVSSDEERRKRRKK